ncbi:MAG TPA: hypothetical protein VN958_02840, partial [Chitinophagaceae bacterium]|nr:hypothetical protein [Chitinophagaceae bacterium]
FQLPRRLSYDQDHWGYCNNSTGSANQYFTPAVSNPLCTGAGGGANRNAKWPDMSAFTLINIQDPLGVKTSFLYEANSASNVYGISTVGGLRIHQITNKDSLTGSVQIRSFNYVGDGVIYKMPKYLIIPKNEYYEYYVLPTLTSGTSSYKGYSYISDITNLIKQSQSIVPLQDAQGNHIGYPMVQEVFGPHGEGGSKTYKFQIDLAPGGNSRLDMSNYTANSTIKNIELGV